jgi:hypothetical protein
VGLEHEGAVVVLEEAAGDVLVAEEELVVGLLRRGDDEDELRLGQRPLGVEALVSEAGVMVGGRPHDLDDGGAGLEERAARILAVPALQPRQGQGIAVELQRTVESRSRRG